MHVGLDLLYLIPGETGGRETYARELVPELLARSPELELTAFLNRDAGPTLASELGERVRPVVLPVSARSRVQWAAGELALLSWAARKAGVELLHSMANFAPASGSVPRVVTIHDLQYKVVPELLSPPARVATHALVSLAARRSERIIAVSAAGGREIVSGLGVDPGKIDVVPNGVRRLPPTAPTPAASAEVREPYRLEQRPVALTVATNLPHKNLPILFEALALIAPEQRPILVLAGHGTDAEALRASASTAGVADDVRGLGGLSTGALEDLYALAACLVLPTLHEGFGLPVLEAMARGVPVVCSDIAALHEIAGEVALYFDPRSPSQIAARLGEVLESPDLARRLREAGRARAKRFSWQAAAEGTLASYQRALSAAAPAG